MDSCPNLLSYSFAHSFGEGDVSRTLLGGGKRPSQEVKTAFDSQELFRLQQINQVHTEILRLFDRPCACQHEQGLYPTAGIDPALKSQAREAPWLISKGSVGKGRGV